MKKKKLKKIEIYIYEKGENTYEIQKNDKKTEIWIYNKYQFLKEKVFQEFGKTSNERIIEKIEKSNEKWAYEYEMDMFTFGIE